MELSTAICEEKTFTIQDFNIAAKLWNPNASHPVLCLHGKMDNAASFDLLAPLLGDRQVLAVDLPGAGLSSHYPLGILPHWKNDALRILQAIETCQWKQFDIIAHSFGSLHATFLAVVKPASVRRVIFLDILGPTVNFIEHGMSYLAHDVDIFLTYQNLARSYFPTKEAAIHDRMEAGNISYQAAQALVNRGTTTTPKGIVWTFDQRLRCVSATLPYEDEVQILFKAIQAPVYLIRANQGVPYPEEVFQARAQAFKNFTVYEVAGGHHVHMDKPEAVADIITDCLSTYQ